MAMTPTLIVAASNLTSNIGLQPNATMVSSMTTVNSNSLITNYANLQPGTANGTTLSGRGFSVVNLRLPEFVANANTTIATVQTQYGKMLPANGDGTYNIYKFASLLSSVSAFAYTSWTMNNLLETFYSKTFGDLGAGVTDYVSSINNGLTADEISALAPALRNLGTAFDINNLSSLHDPRVFVNNLVQQGLLHSNWNTTYANSTLQEVPSTRSTFSELDSKYPYTAFKYDGDLPKALALVTGSDLDNIIAYTNIQLPNSAVVTNLGDLMDLTKIFPGSAVAVVPNATLAGLSNLLTEIGGHYNSFADLADMIGNLSVPSIPYLNTYTVPVPNAEYTRLTAKLGTGSGTDANPLVTDMLGTVAGVVHTNALSTISSSLTSVLTYTEAQNLSTALNNLARACVTGNNTYIDGNIALTWTAANTFTTACNTNATLKSIIVSANTAVKSMQTQLALELDNLNLADASLDSTAPTGVNAVLGLVNNLHDYGVDAYELGYNTLFNNCAQSNVGGDAVRAALFEGRNLAQRQQKSASTGTLITPQVRS
jgi:hypothetical protein